MNEFFALLPSEVYISLTFAFLGGIGTYLVIRSRATMKVSLNIYVGITSALLLIAGVLASLLIIFTAIAGVF